MNRFFMRKSVSIMVMVAFFSMMCFYSIPMHANQPVKTEKQEKVKAAGSETEAEAEISEYYSRDDANVIEDEGYPGTNKKKFPWLLVVGGVVVVGAVLYFTVFKTKKYDLTVTLGAGVTGTPAATQKYKKGTVVSYNYTPEAGYEQVSVKVDGVTQTGTGGTITMDAAHSISVTAMKTISGNFSGTTNQAYAISLRAAKVSGTSTLTYYQIKIKSDTLSGYYVIVTVTHYNPAAPIMNYAFDDTGTYVDLDGVFTPNGTTTVTGSWALHYYVSGWGTFRGSGTYNASQTLMGKPLGTLSKLGPESVKVSAEVFTEDGKFVRRIEK
jgi:hypothetical protein